MNLRFYLEKLHNLKIFLDFMKENPSAYLCSGFFVIDKIAGKNQIHFDFYIPEKNKMFSFKMETCEKSQIEIINEIPEKISGETDFDFNEIEKLIEDEIAAKGINNRVQKILLSLQRKDKKDFLIGTVFISSFGLIRIDVNIDEMKITFFEKKSFWDMLKIIKKSK